MRRLTYSSAIREAYSQLLSSDPRVFVIGQGLWSPWYVGNSMTDLDKEFGRDRLIDSPVSENAVTGTAIGAALAGMRPIVVHPRMDFMLLAMDPIVNQAANWAYLFGGQVSCPVVVRPIVNRGGEQGAQHSQALHAHYAHVPGLKVVMPSTPRDAKGLLIAAVNDPDPVVYIDDRWLYSEEGEVPEELYEEPIGCAAIRREGTDVSIVAISFSASLAVDAATQLEAVGVSAEVVDLRSLKPWDRNLVRESVRKTGRLVVVDGGWYSYGVAAEVAASMAEDLGGSGALKVKRVTLPDVPAPTSRSLEAVYYPTARTVFDAVQAVLGDRE